jgi:hypothetical protein
MRRTFLIVVLALGTVLGFASGFAHLHGHRHGGWHGGHGRTWCDHEQRPRDSPKPEAP